MSWRWPWQRPNRVTEPYRAERGSRSREVWTDLTRSDDVLVQATEVAAGQDGDLAALERVLNEPALILDRSLMACGRRWRCRGGGQR